MTHGRHLAWNFQARLFVDAQTVHSAASRLACIAAAWKYFMKLDDDLAALESRIAAATARCAVLRTSGPLEVYMEAFDEVESLELQLKLLASRPHDDKN